MTVLQELQEKITPAMLIAAARSEKELSAVQRLGWLLEQAGNIKLADKLAEWMYKQRPRETSLDPAAPRKSFSRGSRWKVIVNAEVEGEL